jgi:hypothetical protein
METTLHPKDRFNPLALGDALKTVLLSLIAYSTLFAFECGYCDWFRIPHDFIRLDVTRFLVCASAIAAIPLVLFSAAVLGFEITRKWPSNQKELLRFFAPATIVALLGWLMFVVSRFSWPVFEVTIGLAVFVQCVLFVGLLGVEGSFRERVAQSFSSRPKDDLPGLIAARFGYSWQILAASVFILIVASYFTGIGEARRQREFLVNPERSLIVLRVYGDRALCAPLVTGHSQEIEPSFSLWDVAKGTDFVLKLQKVGPLKINDK